MRNKLFGRRRAWLAVSVALLAVVGGVGAWLLTQDSSAAESPATQLAADRAAVLAAEAGPDEAKRAAFDATLRATIAGTVVSLDLAVGDRVSGEAGDSAAAAAADGETTSAVR